jgi:hypothetical protein
MLFGYYPELIQADKIYATNDNRKWGSENSIRLTATPKGKNPEKLELSIQHFYANLI